MNSLDTVNYIMKKYDLFTGEPIKKFPIEIPNVDRVSLAKLFGELGFKTGVEIGVEQGLYSQTLLENGSSNVTLYCVDPWLAYQGYREHVSQEKLDGFLSITNERLRKTVLETSKNFKLIRKTSVEAAKMFDNESLDFVYIDGNHEFSHVVADICAWYPKVKKGGIISGHDFISRKDPQLNMHVPEAVRGFTGAYQIKPWFVLGRKERLEGERRDNTRSWMFVK